MKDVIPVIPDMPMYITENGGAFPDPLVAGQVHDADRTQYLIDHIDAMQQAMADLENINAHLFSIEALMERIFDVRVPEEVEQKFREVAGELAPDPLNADRLRLNRLLHQTPDLPDHRP